MNILLDNKECFYIVIGGCDRYCNGSNCLESIDTEFMINARNGNELFQSHLSADERGLFFMGISI